MLRARAAWEKPPASATLQNTCISPIRLSNAGLRL